MPGSSGAEHPRNWLGAAWVRRWQVRLPFEGVPTFRRLLPIRQRDEWQYEPAQKTFFSRVI